MNIQKSLPTMPEPPGARWYHTAAWIQRKEVSETKKAKRSRGTGTKKGQKMQRERSTAHQRRTKSDGSEAGQHSSRAIPWVQ